MQGNLYINTINAENKTLLFMSLIHFTLGFNNIKCQTVYQRMS